MANTAFLGAKQVSRRDIAPFFPLIAQWEYRRAPRSSPLPPVARRPSPVARHSMAPNNRTQLLGRQPAAGGFQVSNTSAEVGEVPRGGVFWHEIGDEGSGAVVDPSSQPAPLKNGDRHPVRGAS